MAIERSYGNTSTFENVSRLRYGVAIQPFLSHTPPTEKPDCITCRKQQTGEIPKTKQCITTCHLS